MSTVMPSRVRSAAFALALVSGVALGQPRDDKPAPANDTRTQLKRIVEMQKQIAEAAKAGDADMMRELMTKMGDAMRADRNVAQLRFGGAQEQPKSDLRVQYEMQLKEFADSIAKLKDDQEGREGIEKARDEYKKAMESELKKADDARPAPPPQRNFGQLQVPGIELFPFPGGDPFGMPGIEFGMPGFDLGFRNPRLNSVQPRLGVKLEKPSATLTEQLDLPANVGIVVLDVMRGMPADKAGLKPNDILLQWAGKDLPANVEDFQQMVAAARGGEKFDAVVLRKGKKETIKGIALPEARRPGLGAIFNQTSTSIQINGTAARIQATTDGVKYDITGEAEGGKVQPSQIAVTDGDETLKYESIDKVPEKYKATVERLVNLRGRE